MKEKKIIIVSEGKRKVHNGRTSFQMTTHTNTHTCLGGGGGGDGDGGGSGGKQQR